MDLNLLKQSPLLTTLNWDEIMAQLSSYIHFEANKKRISKSPFFKKKEDVLQEFNLTTEIINSPNYFDLYQQIITTLPQQLSAKQILNRLQKHSWPTISEINTLLRYVEAYLKIIYNENIKLNRNLFNSDKQQLNQFKQKILRPLRRYINISGEINYNANPQLKPLYQEVLRIQQQLRNKLKELIANWEQQGILQNNQWDIINGRYVLAVRSDSYNSQLGIIISKSQSHLTLYIEPVEIEQTNYNLLAAQSKLEQKLLSLIEEEGRKIIPFSPLLYNIIFQIEWFDRLMAKAQFAIKFRLTRPQIIDQDRIKLKDFFHPLITNPIPNSIEIETTIDGLVISGPNTGGKTVTLKSIALAALFIHAGLFIPAKEGELPWYDGIYFFANDQQDLMAGLSSFAAETKNYMQLFEELETKNLILIDEVFNSTSSEEASALALAIIDEILENFNAKIFISSHHYSFKTLMQLKKNFLNAHVGIQSNPLAPTYQLHVGTPGSSMALDIFTTLAKNSARAKRITSHAQNYLQQDQIKYETLLQKLSTEEGILKSRLNEIEKLEQQLKQQKESQKHLLALEKEQMKAEYHRELQKILQAAEELLKKIKRGEISAPKKFFIHKSKLEQPFKETPENSPPTIEQRLLPTPSIEVGKRYYCTTSNNFITVQKVDQKKGQALVTHKNFKFSVALNTLFLNPDKAKEEITINVDRSTHHLPLEKKCIGMRLEEFQATVEQYLSAILIGDLPYAIITHGHGDGILKNWLRKTIDQRPEFRWNNIDGNDGQTRIELV